MTVHDILNGRVSAGYRRIAAASLLVLAGILTGTTAWLVAKTRPTIPVEVTGSSQTVDLPVNSLAAEIERLPAAGLVEQLDPLAAMEENAKRAFDARPDSPASPFLIVNKTPSFKSALQCLAQAVYYEAANESLDGQRAVAQIVLNRVRHRGYPGSVCGVVYQGANRLTGCQFTFTCDGSLARTPVAALWKRSEQVAREALTGFVFTPVGHATHYHANYVVPYWAKTLDKQVQIGQHIFYRLRGTLGAPNVFNQAYQGQEMLPPPLADIAKELTEGAVAGANEALPSPIIADSGWTFTPSITRKLEADDTKGSLVTDQPGGLVAPPSGSTLICDEAPAPGKNDGSPADDKMLVKKC